MPYFRPSMSLQSAKIWTMSLNLVLFEPLERCWDMPCKKNRSGGMVRVFLTLVLFVPLSTYICCAWSHCVDCHFVNVYKCHAMLSIAALSKYFSPSNVRLLVQGCVNNCFVSYRLPAARIKAAFQFFNLRKLDSLTNKTQKYEIEQFCKFRLGWHQDDVEVVVLEALHRCWGQQRPRQDG